MPSPSGVMGPHNQSLSIALSRPWAACIELPDRFGVAQGNLGKLRVRADLFEDFPGSRAFRALGRLEHDRHALDVFEAEGLRGPFAGEQLRAAGDGDLG